MKIFKLTTTETILWIFSIVVIILSFFLANNSNFLILTASIIGATALIYCSKGNVLGQILIVVFSFMYGIISFSLRYYGEMITYLGMTAPIAIASIFTWIKNPSSENKAEVKVNKITMKEYVFLFAITLLTTFVFYFILRFFNTSNLLFSTISIATSFIASYLTMRRSELYAIAYALNDVVLIILWIMATLTNIEYIAMVMCFIIFLLNDFYGFINWSKLKKNQLKNKIT